MYNPRLHRFSVFTAVSTFLLIFLGGLVTSTGSGLAVPDWPTTYGENMFTYPIDKWVGGIKYEHGHRLFASFVGLLTMILAVWLGIKEQRKWVRVLGYTALGLVVAQGILGGITVLFLLPTPVSVAHGMTAQIFFCIVSSIALITSQWWFRVETKDFPALKKNTLLALTASVFVFLQLLFGAVLRHTYSGLAVPDFPLAYGQLIPSLSEMAVQEYNRELIRTGIKWAGDKPIESYQIIIHLLHRYWAYAVALMLVYTGYTLQRSPGGPHSLSRNGKIIIAAVTIQFILGMLTVLTRKEIIITTAHVAVGAVTLVVCIITTIQLLKIRKDSNRNA
jgi:cytochrome c oxidase assembly protein subunit 15